MAKNFNITIGFSTTNQFISGIIRWATRSSCSHAYISFYDSALEMRMVIQSQPWGFEVRPWGRWIKENILVAEYRPVSGDLDDSLIFIAGLLGTKFDYSSALITGIKVLVKRWYKSGFSINPNRSPLKLVCAEAVIRFLIHGKYISEKDFNPEITSPAELFREVVSSDKFEPVFIGKKFINFDRVLRNLDIDSMKVKIMPGDK